MGSTDSFLFSAVTIYMFLNSHSVQSSNYNISSPRQLRRYEDSAMNMQSEFSLKPNNRESFGNHSSNSTDHSDDSFPKDSLRQINNDYLSRTTTKAVKLDSSFSSDPTLAIAKDSRDTIASTALPTQVPSKKRTTISRAARRYESFRRLYEKFAIGLRRTKRTIILVPRPPKEPVCATPYRHIMGGYVVKTGLSHVIALGRWNEDKQFVLHCGGSLIDSRWVLTAAHCTHSVSGGLTIARVGMKRLSDTEGKTVSIIQTIRHPSYKPPALYADIALLKLEEPMVTRTVKPACLLAPGEYMPYTASICGWGATEFGTFTDSASRHCPNDWGTESDALLEAYLQIVNNDECARAHNGSIAAPDGVVQSMYCARDTSGSQQQDTCSGDSGGPLQTIHPKWTCLHQIIGITSFGSGCAFPGAPGVYTSVSHYVDWIEDILWPEH